MVLRTEVRQLDTAGMQRSKPQACGLLTRENSRRIGGCGVLEGVEKKEGTKATTRGPPLKEKAASNSIVPT